VESVGEVEPQRDHNSRDQERADSRHAFLMMMPSMTFATSSQRSSESSSSV
jgi:hypothetical protein